MSEDTTPKYKKQIVKLIGKLTGAHCYCYSEGRVKLGIFRIETGIKKPGRDWAVGAYYEIGGYEGDEKQIHFALGPLYIYASKEYGKDFDKPKRYGFNLTSRVFQLWYGDNSYFKDDEYCAQIRCNYRDWILDTVFGKTMYFRHDIDFVAKTVMIPMPEGSYPAKFTRQRSCWMRPRWPFRKVVESIDIDIPKGIPFAGKGENSWDMDDDGLFGMGSDTWDEAKAVKAVQDSVNRQRRKHGAASPETVAEALR